MYEARHAPLASTLCVVNIGQTEAKVEAVMHSFLQLARAHPDEGEVPMPASRCCPALQLWLFVITRSHCARERALWLDRRRGLLKGVLCCCEMQTMGNRALLTPLQEDDHKIFMDEDDDDVFQPAYARSAAGETGACRNLAAVPETDTCRHEVSLDPACCFDTFVSCALGADVKPKKKAVKKKAAAGGRPAGGVKKPRKAPAKKKPAGKPRAKPKPKSK